MGVWTNHSLLVHPSNKLLFFTGILVEQLHAIVRTNRSFEEQHEMILLLVLQERIFQINVSLFKQHVDDALVANVRTVVKVRANVTLDVFLAHVHQIVNLHDPRHLAVSVPCMWWQFGRPLAYGVARQLSRKE
jgi:hypothetical protein